MIGPSEPGDAGQLRHERPGTGERFTGAELTEVVVYFRRVWDMLGLEVYRIFIMHEPPDKDCWATVEPTVGKHVAKLWICDEFYSMDAPDIREATIHEGIHVMMDNQEQVVRLDLAPYMGENAHSMFWDGYKRLTEKFVDQMTMAIRDFFPLPQWKEGEHATTEQPAAATADNSGQEEGSTDKRPGSGRTGLVIPPSQHQPDI